MKNKRILIADDEEMVRLLLFKALKPYNYEMDIVKNGVEAISHIEKKQYDLIITDYMMPKMNGLELTQRIRIKFPYIPIIIVTGNGPIHDLLKNGATACITKPFKLSKLQKLVKTFLNQ